MSSPPFGTASAYSDSFPSSPPKQVTISPETCYQLSIFRDMVKQYRRLDDQIITRLNRAQAQLRDQSRHGSLGSGFGSSSSGGGVGSSSSSSSRDMTHGMEGMCLRLWSEMMAGWAHRQTLLSYCLQTVTASMEVKRGTSPEDSSLSGPAIPPPHVPAFSSPPPPSASSSGTRRGWKEEEVLANQLGNEQSIEAIIRKRTLEAFRSRCPYFHPPDQIGKEWWDLADSGRSGRGPDVPDINT